jgi:hypothetical protein
MLAWVSYFLTNGIAYVHFRLVHVRLNTNLQRDAKIGVP